MIIQQVYIITNKINQKIYIGRTNNLNHRWICHKSNAKLGKPFGLYNAMRKYGSENFSIEPVEYYATKEEAKQAEIYWIATMRNYLGRCNVYNGSDGGEAPMAGLKHTEEAKDKIRKAVSGTNSPHYGKKYDIARVEKTASKKRKFSREIGLKIFGEYLNEDITMAKLAARYNVSTKVIFNLVKSQKKIQPELVSARIEKTRSVMNINLAIRNKR